MVRRGRSISLSVGVLAGLALAACGAEAPAPQAAAGTGAPLVVEVHRSPTCECCHGHADYLRRHGMVVTEVEREDLAAFKAEVGVPDGLGSCHTTMIAGYFVEGHVPIEAIEHLLDTRPAIDGITLPGMPAGSPGMGGRQEEPWTLYAVLDGQAEAFMTL